MYHERWFDWPFFVCFRPDSDNQHPAGDLGTHRHPRASSMFDGLGAIGQRSMPWSTDEDVERLLNLRSRQTRVENVVRPVQSGTSAFDHRSAVEESTMEWENQPWRTAVAAAMEVAMVTAVLTSIDSDPMYSVSSRDSDSDWTLTTLLARTGQCPVPTPRFRAYDQTVLLVSRRPTGARHVEDECARRWFVVLSVGKAPVSRYATTKESSSVNVSFYVVDQ